MLYLLIKAAISGLIIAIASEVARRSPALGALVIALPTATILAMVWLWRDTGDAAKVAALTQGTVFYVLATLPFFFVVPWLLRSGWGFWAALGIGSVVTVIAYLAMTAALARLGYRI
ncbi:MAG: DUF3147 family protein [Sphingomonadales bacterium]|nr:DUF3147 family protein [Sphingomonadales bacterium]